MDELRKSNPRSKFAQWAQRLFGAAFWAFALAFAVLVVFSMGGNRNEDMYVAAGVLYTPLGLYRDFGFLQTPLLPMLYAPLFAVAGPGNYYLTAKVFQAVMACLELILVFGIAARLCRSTLCGYAAVVMVLFVPYHFVAFSQAANYILAVNLSLGATWLLFEALHRDERDRRRILLFAGFGLCTGLSISAKLTHAVLLPAMAIALCIDGWKQRTVIRQWIQRILLPVLIGGAAGLMPLLLYILLDPKAFYLNNWLYHQVHAEYAREYWGYETPMEYRLKWLTALFYDPSRILLLSAFLLSLAGGILKGLIGQRHVEDALVPLLGICALFGLLIPYPTVREYYAIFLPFQVFVVGWALGKWGRSGPPLLSIIAITLMCIFAWFSDGKEFINRVRNIESWPVNVIQSDADRFRQIMDGARHDGPVLTLKSILVLDAGYDIYPELATGQFLWRAARRLPSPSEFSTPYWQPAEAVEALAKNPPASVVHYGDEEGSLFLGFASIYGYDPHIDIGKIIMVRPAGELARIDRKTPSRWEPLNRLEITSLDIWSSENVRNLRIQDGLLKGEAEDNNPYLTLQLDQPVNPDRIDAVTLMVRFPKVGQPFMEAMMSWDNGKNMEALTGMEPEQLHPLRFFVGQSPEWKDHDTIDWLRFDITDPADPGLEFEIESIVFEKLVMPEE